ncbi:MAG: hypothetical protein WCF24_01975 [Acidimicrobiales bacterium]
MALLDKMKQQAAQVAQKAQEAGRAGQAKIEEVQARRQLDALYHDLGAAVYADHAGRGDQANTAEINRLYGEIATWEQEHPDEPTSASDSSDAPTSASDSPNSPGGAAPSTGDFKLD